MLSSFASALRSRQTAAASSPPSGFRGVPPSAFGFRCSCSVFGPGLARRPLRRRSGRDHDVLDPRRASTATQLLWVLAPLDRLRSWSSTSSAPGWGSPRARARRRSSATSTGRAQRRSSAGTLVVANAGTTCAEFAGVAAGLELAGVSRYVSVPPAAVAVGFARPRGAASTASSTSCCVSTGLRRLRRRRRPRPSRLGRGGPGPRRARAAAQPRRDARRHRRPSAPRSRRGGSPSSSPMRSTRRLTPARPAARARRRRRRRGADRRDRRLRRRRLRGDSPRDRHRDIKDAATPPSPSSRWRGTLPRRSSASASSAPPAGGGDSAAVDRLLGLGGLRPRGDARRLLRRRRSSTSRTSAMLGSRARRSCSSRACRSCDPLPDPGR